MSRPGLFGPESFNLAEVTRGIEVARRMDAECVFAGYSRRYAGVVEEAGFEFRYLQPELTQEQADQLLALDQGRTLRHPSTEVMLAERVVNERALIRELDACAVVIGTTMSQLISARYRGFRWCRAPSRGSHEPTEWLFRRRRWRRWTRT